MVYVTPAKLNELASLFEFKDANRRDHVLHWANTRKPAEVIDHPFLIRSNLPPSAKPNI
jgi:hypothetical protein